MKEIRKDRQIKGHVVKESWGNERSGGEDGFSLLEVVLAVVLLVVMLLPVSAWVYRTPRSPWEANKQERE